MQEKPAANTLKRRGKRFYLVFSVITAAVIAALSIALTGQWDAMFRMTGLSTLAQETKDASFSLHVLDVGKADAMIVRCGNAVAVIDGGTIDTGNKLAAYLYQMDASEIDFVINTHPDNDHLQGLTRVAEQFAVDKLMIPVLPAELVPDTDEYRAVMEAYTQRSIPVVQVKAGETLWLDQAKIEVLAPAQIHKTINNYSLVLKVTYGQSSFLLMGDAEREEEAELLEAGVDLRADVLKVGHHGSNTSTTQVFLNAVQPSMAVISVGYDRNQLPKAQVLKRLEQSNVKVYCTDLNGSVVFTSDGIQITVLTELE